MYKLQKDEADCKHLRACCVKSEVVQMVVEQFDCLDTDYSCVRGLGVGRRVLEKADKVHNFGADIVVFVDQDEIPSHESRMTFGGLTGQEMQMGELEIVDHMRYE